jgi:hypothetical protein
MNSLEFSALLDCQELQGKKYLLWAKTDMSNLQSKTKDYLNPANNGIAICNIFTIPCKHSLKCLLISNSQNG